MDSALPKQYSNRKPLISLLCYLFALLFNATGALYFPKITAYVLPTMFILIPLAVQRTINLRISIDGFVLGITASIILLSPFIVCKALSGGGVYTPPIDFVLITFCLVAMPEEAFFRGFLMESIGCNIRGVIISSLLFALAHGHRYFINGDYLAFFTFIPSLIMGILYMKTRSILPSTIFHGLSNITLLMIF